MENIYEQGYLRGESRVSQNIEDLVKGCYDIAILTTSWDSRCLSILKSSKFKSMYGILLFFIVRDIIGLRDKHDELLNNYINEHCKEVIRIQGYSLNVEGMWQDIYINLKEIYNKMNQPLKIFLDLSTCPRFYALALIGTCFAEGIVESLTILYAEGIYSNINSKNDLLEQYRFTEGHWRTVAVPSLEGSYDPDKKRFYLVSAGFETLKTLQVINREDPDRIGVLFPDPGVLPEYVSEALKGTSELIQTYKIPDGQIIRVHACDTINAWEILERMDLERPESENVYYLCTGTKPHAVALALRGICLGYPTVLYRIPEKHKVIEVKPSGNYWLSKISDLSSIPKST